MIERHLQHALDLDRASSCREVPRAALVAALLACGCVPGARAADATPKAAPSLCEASESRSCAGPSRAATSSCRCARRRTSRRTVATCSTASASGSGRAALPRDHEGTHAQFTYRHYFRAQLDETTSRSSMRNALHARDVYDGEGGKPSRRRRSRSSPQTGKPHDDHPLPRARTVGPRGARDALRSRRLSGHAAPPRARRADGYAVRWINFVPSSRPLPLLSDRLVSHLVLRAGAVTTQINDTSTDVTGSAEERLARAPPAASAAASSTTSRRRRAGVGATTSHRAAASAPPARWRSSPARSSLSCAPDGDPATLPARQAPGGAATAT